MGVNDLFKLPCNNDYFLNSLFPSKTTITRVPNTTYETNSVIHKKMIVFCDQGIGKSELVRAIVEQAVTKYGKDCVNAVSSDGELANLMRYGLDDNLIQILFCDDFTIKKVSDETLEDYFKIRHIFKNRARRNYGLVVSIFGVHRFHSSAKEIRSSSDVVVIRNDSLNPYDHSIIKRFINDDGLNDLCILQEHREEHLILKSYSLYRTRTGKIGLIYFPLADKNHLMDINDKINSYSYADFLNIAVRDKDV